MRARRNARQSRADPRLVDEERSPVVERGVRAESDVEQLVGRLRAFLTWLVRTGPVEGVTLSELRRSFDAEARRPE